MYHKQKQNLKGDKIYFALSDVFKGPTIEAGELNSLKAKKETNETKELPVEALAAKTNQILGTNVGRIIFLPSNIRDALKENIVQYFLTSADRFDKDQEKGLDQIEFGKYKASMEGKLQEIIDKYAPTQEMIEERKRQAEAVRKSSEKAEGEAEKKVEDITFDPTKLDTPDGVHGELQKLIAQTAKLQEAGAALSKDVFDFKKAYAKFEEGKKEWSVFLRGSPLVDDDETQQLEHAKFKLQTSAIGKVHELQVKMHEITETGKIINDAPEKIKQEQLAEREENRKAIEEAKAEEEKLGKGEMKNEEERASLERKQQELTQKKAELIKYRESLQDQTKETEVKEGDSTKSRELKGEQLTKFNDHLDGAVKQIDESLKSPSLQDWQRQHLEAKKEELLGHKQSAEKGLASLKEIDSDQRGIFQGAKDDILRATTGAARQELGIDHHIDNTLSPAIDSLESAEKTIEIAKLQQGTKLEQLEAEQMILDSNIENVDQMDQNVADTVLDMNLNNVQFINGIQSQVDEISKIEIDRPNIWNASGGLFFGKVGEGLSLISDGLDEIQGWAVRKTEKIPFVGTAVKVATEVVIGSPSGAWAGLGELVTGINTMVSHPIQTYEGLKTLWGPNAGKAWGAMGKSLIAWDEFEKGHIGKGLGKIILNRAMTVTGVGGAVIGGQALSLTFKAARAAGAGVANATAQAAWMGIKVFGVEVGATLRSAPRDIAKFVKTALGAPKRLVESLIDLGKGVKVEKLAKLEQVAAKMGDELATASSKLDEITIGGKKVSELEGIAGKSFKEIQELSGQELAKLGLKDPKSVREFLKYKQALKESEQLAKAAQLAKAEASAEKVRTEVQAAAEVEAKAARAQLQLVETKVKPKMKELEPKIKDAEARLKTATGETADAIKAELKGLQKELKGLEKELEVSKAKDSVARIRTGEIKFENYEGIRDIAKSAGLTMEEQFQLTKKVLENSGKKIEDLIRMEKTIGPLKAVKVTGTVDDIVKGAEGVEKVIAKLGEAKTLKQMDSIISGVANPAERQLLERLAGDLGGMKGVAIEEAEKVTILKESMRYLQDYKAALKEGGMGSAKSAQDVFDLIRGNQRKLAHQTVVDRSYFTGSDHGVTHILDANMTMADKVFADMGPKISAKDRVLIRQAILDHDMGYTINALEGAKGGKYFGMTKDHPLYSTVWVESKKAEYVKYFGEEGYATIRSSILDHSNAAKLDMTATGSKLVENIVAGVDCLGTTADIKMMKLFREPEMMVELMQLQELAEQLKPIMKQLKAEGKLPAELLAKKAELIQEMMEIKGVMETFVKKSKKFDKPMKESFLKALERNFDPTDPTFAFSRDFGSHSAGFEGMSIADNGAVTVNMSVNENFRLVREMFGGGDEVSTSALAKAMDDYGLNVTKGKKPIATVTRDGIETTMEYSQAQFAADLAKVEKGEMGRLVVKTPRATFNFTRNAEKGTELSSVLKREGAFKKVIEELEAPTVSPVKAREALQTLVEQHDWEGYVLNGKPARTVVREIQDLMGLGKQKEAVQLLKQLRKKGIKLAT